MKRILISIITFFIILAQSFTPCAAQSSGNQDFSKAQISIKYYNKAVYYTGNSIDNPIFVHITIANKGSDTLRFKLADDRVFSIDFSANTVKNEKLAYTDSIIRKRTTNQTVYFREIAIENGEEYSFVENLKDYINIEDPSVYYFEAAFFPELYKTKNIVLSSNRLTLDVKPLPSAAASSKIPSAAVTSQILKPEAISPDKVVEQTIIARQKTLWDQYFLYMDIEEMIMRDRTRKVKYTSLSDIERLKMIETYKLDLMQERIDTAIVSIPESFFIEKTVYSQTEGSVTVIQLFKYDTFREKKRYTYYVRQRDGIWRIYDFSVENMGTE